MAKAWYVQLVFASILKNPSSSLTSTFPDHTKHLSRMNNPALYSVCCYIIHPVNLVGSNSYLPGKLERKLPYEAHTILKDPFTLVGPSNFFCCASF